MDERCIHGTRYPHYCPDCANGVDLNRPHEFVLAWTHVNVPLREARCLCGRDRRDSLHGLPYYESNK